MQLSASNPLSLAALALPSTTGDAQVLLPSGAFDAPRGAMQGSGPWYLSSDRGQALASALQSRARDIPIDYEHQTLRAATNGQPAPAAGWIEPSAIQWDPERGLVATSVHWTDRAAAHIAASEYRYVSPVFSYSADGAVLDLYHVALTNTPALDDLPEVALAAMSSLTSTALEAPMDDLRERVLYLLNLPVTTTDAELLAALDKLKAMLSSDGSTAATSLFDALADRDTRIAALSAQVQQAPGPDVVADLQRQLAALQQSETDRQRASILTAALSDGRLVHDTPLHAYASGLPLDGLQSLVSSLTPIAALTGTQTGGRPPVTDPQSDLTPAELAVCSNLGLPVDEYRKARALKSAEVTAA